MARKPTDLRGDRRRFERNLVIGAALLLIVVGSVLIGALYGWGAAFSGLLCLLPGAGAIVGLWLLLGWIERHTDG